MNTLKMVWKLRERRKRLLADIYDVEMDIKVGFTIMGNDRLRLYKDELAFINELLGEK